MIYDLTFKKSVWKVNFHCSDIYRQHMCYLLVKSEGFTDLLSITNLKIIFNRLISVKTLDGFLKIPRDVRIWKFKSEKKRARI